jgi:RNA polymerase sigma factor (sigma-70 family)
MRRGDPAATEALWRHYFPQLVQLAREKLQGAPRGMADEEDVALSAMNCFYRAAQEGRYPDLADRESLWRLLLQITAHRVIDLKRHEYRQRRSGGPIHRDATDRHLDFAANGFPLDQAIDDAPTPEFAAIMAEEYQQLLEALQDVELRAIAVAKMEGTDNAEIAALLNCSERTIERRIKLIRDKWKHIWQQRRQSPR